MWHRVLPVIVAGKSHAWSLETSGASYAGSDKPLHQRKIEPWGYQDI